MAKEGITTGGIGITRSWPSLGETAGLGED